MVLPDRRGGPVSGRAGELEAVHSCATTHLLVELWGCAPEALGDAALIEATLLRAAATAGATVIGTHVYERADGVTSAAVLAESHLSIHTWLPLRRAMVDIFTCGEARPRRAVAVVERALGARRCAVLAVPRGRGPLGPWPG